MYGCMSVELPDPVTLVREVVVRLVRPEERPRWDTLMDAHHYLGFKQFAGRGLRYVAEWNGEWLALLGWQTGVFQCRPRDRWLGWHKAVQFRRLHLIGNNTRYALFRVMRCRNPLPLRKQGVTRASPRFYSA